MLHVLTDVNFQHLHSRMTVRYNYELDRVRPFRFVKLLFRWKGSFYKLIVYQVALYCVISLFFHALPLYILNEAQQKWFREFCRQIGYLSGYAVASVMFCLGFFIEQVYKRFCFHFQQVPWPDGFSFLVSVCVKGKDQRGRILRRTMVRYAVASIILTWMNFSDRMKQFFPQLESLVVAGFLTENEMHHLREIRPGWRQLVVCSWCSAVIGRARKEKRIRDECAMNAIIKQLDIIRGKSRRLIQQNGNPIHLAYFQNVIIAIYSFFLMAAVSGTQRYQSHEIFMEFIVTATPTEKLQLRILAELVTLLQFVICAGVLCTSSTLISPFGRDDSNIDVIDIVRRHLCLAYLVVDELHSVIPQMDMADSNGKQSQTQPEAATARSSRRSSIISMNGSGSTANNNNNNNNNRSIFHDGYFTDLEIVS